MEHRPGSRPRHKLHRSPLTRRLLAGALSITIGAGALMTPGLSASPSWAATVHEIEGEWATGTPSDVRDGTKVSAAWRISVNDDAPAPDTTPVDDVAVVLTAQHGTFDALPEKCLTTGVAPVSAIAPDGATLTCNVGTQAPGTAVWIKASLVARGSTGDVLTTSATAGGRTETLPPITVTNPFGMDIRWQDQAHVTRAGTTHRDVPFQWTLFHEVGGPAGPSTVTYTLTVSNDAGAGASVPPTAACSAFTGGTANGHPWSGGSHPTDQLAPMPTCTFRRISATGSGTATFELTLSNIDYSYAQRPTKDSTGAPLPADRVAVAAGQVTIRFATTSSSARVTLTSSSPTYTATTGATARDDASNNGATTSWTSGTWTHGWVPSHTGSSSSQWTDTYRAAVGSTVRQTVSYTYRNQATQYRFGGQCLLLDTKYVAFERASTVLASTGGTVPGATLHYYTGTDSGRLDPSSPSYDLNASTACDLTTGWTSIPPTDLSTVRAVKSVVALSTDVLADRVALDVDTTILPTTPAGMDVWTGGSYANTTDSTLDGVTWAYPNRGATPPAMSTMTPGARYPFAAAGRDVLRTVAATPRATKEVSPRVVSPGATVDHTVTYSAEAAGGTTSVDAFTIVDTLPADLTYVAGSATPAPTVSTSGGRQVLTWTLDGVTTNTPHTLSYGTRAGADLEPGSTLVSTVSARLGQLTSPTQSVDLRVASDGSTQVAMTADQTYVPNTHGDGTGQGSWTVALRSQDPVAETWTDVIDVLPYVGDGRGTRFSGTYALSGPVVAPAGATVLYTTADPATLHDDPAHASNGTAGDATGNTVGWSTTYAADATAVRVVGGRLAPGATTQFTVGFVTEGAKGGDVFVNRAQGRASHTKLAMRTSARTTMAHHYSAQVKKYVRDKDGEWHDANDPVDHPTFRIGDTVRYRVVVTNTGEGTLRNIVVTDDEHPTPGAFTVAELEGGGSRTHEYDTTVGASSGGTLVSTASAAVDTPADASLPPVIPSDPAGIEVANWTVATSADPASGTVLKAGDVVTYTVTVTPEGTAPANAWFRTGLAALLDDATYDDDVSATLGTVGRSGSTLAWSGTLTPGTTATITYTVTVKDVADLGDSELTHTLLSPGCLTQCATEHTVVDPRVALGASVSRVSDVNGNGLKDRGDELWYEFAVTNNGNVPLSGVGVDAPLLTAAGITVACTPTTLAPGARATCLADAGYRVTQTDVDAGSVLNRAVATGTPSAGSPVASRAAETETLLDARAALGLVSSASRVSSPAVAGDVVTWSFVATNTGTVTLTDVVVAETAFSGSDSTSALTCTPTQRATLAPGDTLECRATYALTQGDVDAGTLTHEAQACADGRVCAGDDVTLALASAAGIDLVSTVDQTDLVAGRTATYTFVATNRGTVTLTDVAITRTAFSGSGSPSALSCTPSQPSRIAPGEALECTATYDLTQADVDAGTVDSAARVTGTAPSGAAVTAQDDARISGTPEPALELDTPVADVEDVNGNGRTDEDDRVRYEFRVRNTGNVTLTDVGVDDSVLASSGITVVCAPTTLAPGATATCAATTAYVITAADVERGAVHSTARARATFAGQNLSVRSKEAAASTPTAPLEPAPPSGTPTPVPTATPSTPPSEEPTASPSESPSESPTDGPGEEPSQEPREEPREDAPDEEAPPRDDTPDADTPLPDTGGPSGTWLVLGGLLVLAGAVLLRRRRGQLTG